MNLLKWLQTKAEKFFAQTPEPQIFDAQSPLLLEGQNHQRNGDLNSALNCYHKEIEESPFNPYGHLALGNILAATGQFEEAAPYFQQAARLKPDFVEAHCNLGSCLKDMGRLQEAIIGYRQAIEISPNFLTAHLNMGNTLLNLGQLEQARESFQKALQLNPNLADAHNGMGNICERQGLLHQAAEHYQKATELSPQSPIGYYNTGNILRQLGLFEEAVANFRKVTELKPDFDLAWSNLLFALIHSSEADPETIFAEHQRFGERFEKPWRNSWPKHQNNRDPNRTLRIGFVSGDFRDHAMSNFIGSLLPELAALNQLELHAYHNYPNEDSTTAFLKQHFQYWNPISSLTDEELSNKIFYDGIDILIDLSGHTDRNRLTCFARKPAPIQASWIGYAGTTGLQAMDYYLCDPFFLPPGQLDWQFTEKLAYLPAYFAFAPFEDAPDANELPALKNAYITFGSFNRPGKLGKKTIALWSELLIAIPGSRMVLGAMPNDGEITHLSELFEQAGIDRQRLEFHPRAGMKDYLALHHQVDLCLDTLPYTGSTTTAHALWMGVPTLTISGMTAAGRMGTSIMSHAGLANEFVCADKTEFLKKGLYWVENLNILSEIRSDLRERFKRSRLCHPEDIAASLEKNLRTMWQHWRKGSPPEAITKSK